MADPPRESSLSHHVRVLKLNSAHKTCDWIERVAHRCCSSFWHGIGTKLKTRRNCPCFHNRAWHNPRTNKSLEAKLKLKFGTPRMLLLWYHHWPNLVLTTWQCLSVRITHNIIPLPIMPWTHDHSLQVI